MLSNKLTFSLASFVMLLVLGLVFSATPVMGQDYFTFGVTDTHVGPVTITAGARQSAGPGPRGFLLVTPDGGVSNNDIDAAAGSAPFDAYALAPRPNTPTSPAVSWIDLQDFFVSGGGTIELIGPATSKAKDIVISEIMWGADLEQSGPNRNQSQWIELYIVAGDTLAKDVTAAAPAVGASGADENWALRFTKNVLTTTAIGDTTTAPAGVVVDKVSNWGLGFWAVEEDGAYGQSGNDAFGSPPNVTPAKRRISMYRNINYADAVKTDKTNDEQRAAVPDGTRAGNWKESGAPRGANQSGLIFASPGEQHFQNLRTVGETTTLARDGVVFNEIANRTDKKYEWIELHNKKTTAQKINGWGLSLVTANDKDEELLKFESEHDIMVPGGGYLLVVNSDPAGTPLAVGQNVDEPDTSPQGAKTTYYVNEKLDLPEKALLILRSGTDKYGKAEKLVDVAAIGGGYHALIDKDYNTDVWPLKATAAGAKDDLTANDKTWKRDQGKALFHGDAWKAEGGFTGVGVNRNISSDMMKYASGTPGYANDAVQDKFFDGDTAKFTGTITISEIMVDQSRRNLPQWIELYNASMTQAVNIKGWSLEILNVDSDDLDSRQNTTLKIDGDLTILPNQTVLVVSGAGRQSDNIPDTAIYSLYGKHRKLLEVRSQRDSLLSTVGFYISLTDANGVMADAAGNIDSDIKTDDEPTWALPMGENSDEMRSSLIRKYMGGAAEDGMAEESWILAENTAVVAETYYGDSDDLGSPGHRKGSPLPVSLSSFRPVRDKATGAVVIHWITQSELNNAGFNILRSETKTGDFKVVNTKGIIPGHGTTSEKHVYTWTDTTAKPNVVYYYQIEDVSLDGDRTTLRTTHLRGNVNAAGKLTTRWGQLKTYGK